MSISFDTPPVESLSEIKRAGRLSSGVPEPSCVPQFAHIESAEPIRLKPHGVYVSSLEDAAAGKAVTNAKLVAWRYLMQDDRGNYFATEVNFNQSRNAHEFSRVSVGPRAANMHVVLETAEKGGFGLPKDKDYKVRVLRIPSLYIEAVWFYSASDNDLIIPVAPSELGSDVTGTVFTVKVFDSLMVERAKTRLAMSDDRLGG